MFVLKETYYSLVRVCNKLLDERNEYVDMLNNMSHYTTSKVHKQEAILAKFNGQQERVIVNCAVVKMFDSNVVNFPSIVIWNGVKYGLVKRQEKGDRLLVYKERGK